MVDGQLKLGRYHITYQDMAVPVGGIPIQVLRTYDTLNKNEVGDFGAGWTLDVSDFRVQVNRPLGQAGWERYVCGGGIIFVQYCYRTTRSHYVTVTWPDGHTETFDFTPQGLSSFFGGAGIAKYTGRPNTTSRLEPAPGQEALGWSGDGNLYDDPFNYTTTYNPTRFVLVAKDGTRYTLDRGTGLVEATDRNGNTVTIDDTGIHSSASAPTSTSPATPKTASPPSPDPTTDPSPTPTHPPVTSTPSPTPTTTPPPSTTPTTPSPRSSTRSATPTKPSNTTPTDASPRSSTQTTSAPTSPSTSTTAPNSSPRPTDARPPSPPSTNAATKPA